MTNISGRHAGGTESFTTYTNAEYGYRLAYPDDWLIEAELPGDASFGARDVSDAGAVVIVDERVDALEAYVEAFMDDLRADEHVHTFEPATRRDVQLESGQPGQIIECPYLADSPAETWRLMYLFTVVDGTTGYTVGVDWNDADPLREIAARILESFTVEGD